MFPFIFIAASARQKNFKGITWIMWLSAILFWIVVIGVIFLLVGI